MSSDKKEMITIILERYNELLSSDTELNALYSAGVDYWDGYEQAMNNS